MGQRHIANNTTNDTWTHQSETIAIAINRSLHSPRPLEQISPPHKVLARPGLSIVVGEAGTAPWPDRPPPPTSKRGLH